MEKERFRLDRDGRTIELDVYAGDLDGLVVAEVEFESEQESADFHPPAWLGREVTGDERYANRRLAVHRIPEEERMSADFPAKPLSAKAQRAPGAPDLACLSAARRRGAGGGHPARCRGRRDETAVEQLRDEAGEDLATAVHDTRKDMKKLRSLLRLVRDELGRKRYRAEVRATATPRAFCPAPATPR